MRSDATYLITGGSGGLAEAFTRGLAHRGAKFIVLASRSGIASARTRRLIEELRVRGVAVAPRKCDVTDKDQVEELVKESLKEMPPIRGVIHGAMDSRVSWMASKGQVIYR
jgi:NAD(P)-dependent dehydrogenase (short-subunit alcohol dehydrogenase family)